MKRWLLFLILSTLSLFAEGQKNYASTSVLATGKWIKISTQGQGVFKVTASFLKTAGVSQPIPSSTIRLFGHGGSVLSESNDFQPIDDLIENEIEVLDGGDGFFDAGDYFLFYAPGANQWTFDSLSGKFQFQKNSYSEASFFFVQIGETNGLRIGDKEVVGSPSQLVESFTEHIRYEKEEVNFLNSGREWYGESFGNGFPSSRNFLVAASGSVPQTPFEFTSEVVGRSFGNPNRVSVSLNGQTLFQHSTSPAIGTLLEPIASVSQLSTTGFVVGNALELRYDFSGSNSSAQSWLNWFQFIFRKKLDQQGTGFISFRDPLAVGKNKILTYNIQSATSNLQVWEVTDMKKVKRMKTNFSNNSLRFVDDASQLREYISFDPQQAKVPSFIGSVVNQNLHGEGFYDMVVVADKSMLQEANRLAEFRQSFNGIRCLVVTPENIYNEFSSGSADPTAIRNFMKMLYDRAGQDQSKKPKYLLLFGGTSFKYKEEKGENKNLIPSYQSESSLDPLTSYVTDDYFGYLDNEDNINATISAPLLDIAVGRIPARTAQQARLAVDKIIAYQTKSVFGPWRNEITLVADDEDFNLHLNDAEAHANLIQQETPVWNINKLYLDAFEQTSGTGGSRYPDVNTSITKGMNFGTLIWNYSGHGGNARLAQEAILEKEMFANWQNQNRLPLFVTATCDFAPFDNPAQFSIGEELLLGRINGAIGLMTTTRLVFASSNKLINTNFLKALLKKGSTNTYPTIGEAWMEAKNTTVVRSGDFINARKFALLGDPSMKLLMPEYQVKTTVINGKSIGAFSDTLKALNNYSVQGEVRTPNNILDANFNGVLYVSVYDKESNLKTLANDPQSNSQNFNVFDNVIYEGKIKVVAGKFSYDFIVPSDIRFEYGTARISYYAENGNYDAQGQDENLIIGGFGGEVKNDNEGPAIKAVLDNEQFKNGGVVNERPFLIAELADKSGINLGGYGIGHDIRLVIDGDYANAVVLNDYFEPVLSENKKGEIRFQLPLLAEGIHKMELKAWDIFNNSSELFLDFKVVEQKKILIERFMNYPNPLTDRTTFVVDLEGPSEAGLVDLEILSLDGKLVQKITETINQVALRSLKIEWNGLDKQGKKPQPGIYVSRLTIKTKTGVISSKVQKLIIL